MTDPTRLDRRSFLRHGAATGVALGATALAPAALARAVTDAPKKWDQTVDVLVVGSGFAGLAAAIEARGAGADVLVIGHFHWPGSWNIDGCRVINTGTFVSPNPAHWVEWSDGLLRRGKVDESGGAYRIGKVLGAWRLEPAAARA